MPATKLFKSLDSNNFLTLEELYKRMGKGFSPSSIRRLINAGKIHQGKHYIKTSGLSGIIKINVAEFENYLISINSK